MSICRHASLPSFRVTGVLFLVAFAALLSSVSDGRTEEFSCQTVDAVVLHEGEANTGVICEGAAAAIAFLGAIGVAQTSPVEINIVNKLPAGLKNAVGCYDWINDDIFLLETDRCLNGGDLPEPFKVPINREIYKSYVAHEVAHAIATQNLTIDRSSAAAHEYIAGVVQLAVMDGERRAEILGRFSGDGFDKAQEINLLTYEIDPPRFAVEAYRHYAKIADGPQFIHKLLSGQIRLRDRPVY